MNWLRVPDFECLPSRTSGSIAYSARTANYYEFNVARYSPNKAVFPGLDRLATVENGKQFPYWENCGSIVLIYN